jgi:hypothetical protein
LVFFAAVEPLPEPPPEPLPELLLPQAASPPSSISPTPEVARNLRGRVRIIALPFIMPFRRAAFSSDRHTFMPHRRYDEAQVRNGEEDAVLRSWTTVARSR